jgi:hypothetical protein
MSSRQGTFLYVVRRFGLQRFGALIEKIFFCLRGTYCKGAYLIALEKQQSVFLKDLVQMEVPLKIFILIPSSVYLQNFQNCQFWLSEKHTKVCTIFLMICTFT